MQKFDKSIREHANLIKMDKKEIAGISVEMPYSLKMIDPSNQLLLPQSKAEYIKNYYEPLITSKPEEKL